VKTIGLDASEQPELHRAATNESAVLENVAVDDDGTVHFDEPLRTQRAGDHPAGPAGEFGG